jgi:hypothetical protein
MLFAGFDPGGKGAFGCCILALDGQGRPTVEGADVVDGAAAAFAWMTERGGDRTILAAGIDAPLYWVTRGEREVDRLVRDALRSVAGARTSTVIHVNSLRGACLVQGVVLARLLQRGDTNLRITEAHPVAADRLLGAEDRELLGGLVQQAVGLVGGADPRRHIRDAVLAAYAACAMHAQRDGWRDVRSGAELHVEDPLARRAQYWMPAPSGRARG